MIEGQEMNMALGLPIYITGFNDGKTRKCYPYKLKDIYKLHSYMEFINQDDFASNLKSEDSLVCIKFLLEESFPETLEDEGENEILRYLDGSNFKEIIHDIEIVNGIGSDSRVTTESMDNGDKESIDWDTSISCIMTYTSNNMEDVSNLTMRQFTNIIEAVGKKITWNYKLDTITLTEDPSSFITTEDHPLKSKAKKKNVMTMSDVTGFGKR